MSRLKDLIAEFCPNGVEYKELRDVLTIKQGKDYKAFGEGTIPVYGSGGVIAYTDKSSYDKPSVLIPRKGSLDKLYYVDEPFWNVDTIFYTEIDDKLVVPRYVFYCLFNERLEKLNVSCGLASLTKQVLYRVKIPVPPLQVQEEIVRILDKFKEFLQELSQELALRQKQYEHYCGELLAFPVKNGAG